MTEIRPFRIETSDDEIADLRRRLHATRWPDAEPVDDWSQGIPLAVTRELCRYWADDYDWAGRAERLNRFPQYLTDIDGLDIHFLHVRSPHDDAMPLLITHGWPGSVAEFQHVIEPLTDPTAHGGDAADAFHVVCPSIPGYGFSTAPSAPGFGVPQIASAWATLMDRLGYGRWCAQGGDWGSMITTQLGIDAPYGLVAIHLNMPLAPPDPATMDDLTSSESAALADMGHYGKQEAGYSKIQSTRPQTLGYGLSDSPAAQLAWIVEKFWAWTDNDGAPQDAVGRDELLDNVMLYWLPNNGTSSARLYWESFDSPPFDTPNVPVGCSIFPREIFRTSRRWAEAHFGELLHFDELDRGGHFAAFEEPDLFVEQVRTCFSSVR